MCYRQDLYDLRRMIRDHEGYRIYGFPAPLAHESEDYDPDEPVEVNRPEGELALSEQLRSAVTHLEFRYLASCMKIASLSEEFLLVDRVNIARTLRRHSYAENRRWTPEQHRLWHEQHSRE